MILALAGRRIDARDSTVSRFPLSNAERVAHAVHGLLVRQRASALVSSAACGADLIGLTEAGKLGLRRRVILPFERSRFRQTSVVDRPGEWGKAYDQVLDEVEAAGDLLILSSVSGADPYSLASKRILEEATELATLLEMAAGAVMVWDGKTREKHDYTAEFGADARSRTVPIYEISTV